MKSIFSILAFIFFLFTTALQAQTSLSLTGNKDIYLINNQFYKTTNLFDKKEMFKPIMFPKLVSEESSNISNLNSFSKDLRSELSNQKWMTVLKENQNVISMIKLEDKDKINLFGNPLMGFTEKKLVFDEPALFSNTLLVYSF